MMTIPNEPEILSQQRIYFEYTRERDAQNAKHGGPDHDDNLGILDWGRLISEHLWKSMGAENVATVRRQLVRIGALATAAIESIDRRYE